MSPRFSLDFFFYNKLLIFCFCNAEYYLDICMLAGLSLRRAGLSAKPSLLLINFVDNCIIDCHISLCPKVTCKSTNGNGYGDIALERPKVLGLGRLGRVRTLGGVPHAPTQFCHGFIGETLLPENI